MQPVPTEYPGLPRTPTRHFPVSRTLALACLGAVLLAVLTACTGDDTEPVSVLERPASLPPMSAGSFADPQIMSAASVGAALTIARQEDRLQLHWAFEPTVVGHVGSDARLHLELLDLQRGSVVVDELRPALTGTPVEGSARLSVEAHRLAWRSLALRARISDSAGTTLAASAPVPLAGMLADGARWLTSTAGSDRFASVLAFSPDGGTLVVADPDDSALRLYPVGRAEHATATLEGGFERLRIAGLAAAIPGSINLAVASFGTTTALGWRDADGVHVQTILEATPIGFTESLRMRFDNLSSPELALTSDGRQLDLIDATGAHERIVQSASSWQRRSRAASDPATALSVDEAGVITWLRLQPGRAATIDTEGRATTLPGTDELAARAIPGGVTLRLGPEGLHIALATLEPAPGGPPSATPTRLSPTLRVFSRTDAQAPWRLDALHRGAPTASDTRSTLRFGRRPSAPVDTLMWHWGRPASDERDPPFGTTGDNGLIMLTTRAPAQAFGIADRSDRTPGQWRIAFSLPVDGTPPVGPLTPTVATLSPDGATLAFAQPNPSGRRVVVIE